MRRRVDRRAREEWEAEAYRGRAYFAHPGRLANRIHCGGRDPRRRELSRSEVRRKKISGHVEEKYEDTSDSPTHRANLARVRPRCGNCFDAAVLCVRDRGARA